MSHRRRSARLHPADMPSHFHSPPDVAVTPGRPRRGRGAQQTDTDDDDIVQLGANARVRASSRARGRARGVATSTDESTRDDIVASAEHEEDDEPMQPYTHIPPDRALLPSDAALLPRYGIRFVGELTEPESSDAGTDEHAGAQESAAGRPLLDGEDAPHSPHVVFPRPLRIMPSVEHPLVACGRRAVRGVAGAWRLMLTIAVLAVVGLAVARPRWVQEALPWLRSDASRVADAVATAGSGSALSAEEAALLSRLVQDLNGLPVAELRGLPLATRSMQDDVTAVTAKLDQMFEQIKEQRTQIDELRAQLVQASTRAAKAEAALDAVDNRLSDAAKATAASLQQINADVKKLQDNNATHAGSLREQLAALHAADVKLAQLVASAADNATTGLHALSTQAQARDAAWNASLQLASTAAARATAAVVEQVNGTLLALQTRLGEAINATAVVLRKELMQVNDTLSKSTTAVNATLFARQDAAMTALHARWNSTVEPLIRDVAGLSRALQARDALASASTGANVNMTAVQSLLANVWVAVETLNATLREVNSSAVARDSAVTTLLEELSTAVNASNHAVAAIRAEGAATSVLAARVLADTTLTARHALLVAAAVNAEVSRAAASKGSSAHGNGTRAASIALRDAAAAAVASTAGIEKAAAALQSSLISTPTEASNEAIHQLLAALNDTSKIATTLRAVSPFQEDFASVMAVNATTGLASIVTALHSAIDLVSRQLYNALQEVGALSATVHSALNATHAVTGGVTRFVWPNGTRVDMPAVDTAAASRLATLQDVQTVVRSALALYDADKVGMADYASAGAGGCILEVRNLTSPTWKPELSRTLHQSLTAASADVVSAVVQHASAIGAADALVRGLLAQSAFAAISPDVRPGMCWPMVGRSGRLTVRLSTRIRIHAVTIDHLPSSVIVHKSGDTGNITATSAINRFEIVAILMPEDGSPTQSKTLGAFTYDIHGPPVQTFFVDAAAAQFAASAVQLAVLDNYGHPHFTCIYRFRVHGAPV